MLQFITNENGHYTIPQQVAMVIEGGCRWIQLRMKYATDHEMKIIAEEIIPLCQETDTILVFDDRVKLTMDLKVHGVHLGKNDMPAKDAREFLGPGAIIGVTANTAEDILAYRGLDVDYIGLGPYRFTETKKNLSPIIGLDGYKNIVSKVRDNGVELPIVAIGGITIDDIDDIMLTGVNGIAMSGAIINSEDPVAYTQKVIDKLNIK